MSHPPSLCRAHAPDAASDEPPQGQQGGHCVNQGFTCPGCDTCEGPWCHRQLGDLRNVGLLWPCPADLGGIICCHGGSAPQVLCLRAGVKQLGVAEGRWLGPGLRAPARGDCMGSQLHCLHSRDAGCMHAGKSCMGTHLRHLPCCREAFPPSVTAAIWQARAGSHNIAESRMPVC